MTLQSLRARALKLERSGDLPGALGQYEAALSLAPGDPGLLASLARLAGRLGLHEVALGFWRKVEGLEALDGQARALRELGRFEEAIDILRAAILERPEEPALWNSLGVVLTQQGEPAQAMTFFDEALRLDPRHATALYNRGGAWFDLGRLADAQADFTAARRASTTPDQAATIDFAAATLALARGDVAAGWEAYEVRLSRDWPGSTAFEGPGQRWTPGTPLAGRRLLALAEQGVGDEIMFANLIPDVQAAAGQLCVAVDPRLVDLFRRSFPGVEVTAHATDRTGPRPRRAAPGVTADLWAPLASLCRQFRRASFPAVSGYLRPDPARVAHWKAWLGPGPPAVGLTWRSGRLSGDRRRQYPSLDAWSELVRTPGVRLVDLQYGDADAERAALAEAAGRPLLAPPLDLKGDLDDLAALTVALDLIVAVSNATGALAGACGANLAMIGAPHAWPRLGAQRYPWYPQAVALAPPALGDWAPVMAEAAQVVRETVSRVS